MTFSDRISPIISASKLNDILNDEHVAIFDCRFSLADPNEGASQFAESRIPGSRYAHLDNDLSSPVGDGSQGRHPLPDMDYFLAYLTESGVSDDTLVVAYDDFGGAFASRLWWLMHRLGHLSVCVLDGGWSSWVAGGFLVDTAPLSEQANIPTAEGTMLEAVEDPQLEISVDQVLSADVALIDSRASQRYLGLEEPIDPVAGHIPGAINRPWMDNLTDEMMFKSPDDLKVRFTPLLDDDSPPMPLAFYCGSGVTACHNILASQIAGLPMPKLYAASWSGWISSGDRPIVTNEDSNQGGP